MKWLSKIEGLDLKKKKDEWEYIVYIVKVRQMQFYRKYRFWKLEYQRMIILILVVVELFQ